MLPTVLPWCLSLNRNELFSLEQSGKRSGFLGKADSILAGLWFSPRKPAYAASAILQVFGLDGFTACVGDCHMRFDVLILVIPVSLLETRV
jgi:hypothetical protein